MAKGRAARAAPIAVPSRVRAASAAKIGRRSHVTTVKKKESARAGSWAQGPPSQIRVRPDEGYPQSTVMSGQAPTLLGICLGSDLHFGHF